MSYLYTELNLETTKETVRYTKYPSDDCSSEEICTLECNVFDTLCEIANADFSLCADKLSTYFFSNSLYSLEGISNILLDCCPALSDFAFQIMEVFNERTPDSKHSQIAEDISLLIKRDLMDVLSPLQIFQMYCKESVNIAEIRDPDFALSFGSDFNEVITFNGYKATLEPTSLLGGIEEPSDVRDIRGAFFYLASCRKKTDSFVFECGNLISYCYSVLHFLLQNGFRFNRCENCGLLFVPLNRADTKYCDHPSPQNPTKTCKEQIKLEKQLIRESKEVIRKKKSIAAMLSKRIDFAGSNQYDIENAEKKYNDFKNHSKEWAKKVRNGLAKEEDYSDWLDTFYMRRKRGDKNGKCSRQS
jgi:hypothetical protein